MSPPGKRPETIARIDAEREFRVARAKPDECMAGARRQYAIRGLSDDKIILPTDKRGAIAQLGERIVRNDEVVGSIPTSSTKFSITCGCTTTAASCFVSCFVS